MWHEGPFLSQDQENERQDFLLMYESLSDDEKQELRREYLERQCSPMNLYGLCRGDFT